MKTPWIRGSVTRDTEHARNKVLWCYLLIISCSRCCVVSVVFQIVSAKKLCFDDPLAFPPEVLGVVLSQLSDQSTLPRLLLHTVIMSMRLHPTLRSFIVSNLLMKLIHKKVYTMPTLWGGFLRTANELRPQSIPVLIQLPDAAFEHMMHMPNAPTLNLDDMRRNIVTYVQSFPLQVRHSIRKLVQHMEQEKAMQRQMQQQQQQMANNGMHNAQHAF